MLLTCGFLFALSVASTAEAQFKGRNGRIFYISDDASGNQRVFSSTAAGRLRKIVSPVGLDPDTLAVSPNGRKLAICGSRVTDQASWIFTGPAAGGKFRRLVEGCDPAFSPEGQRLAYTITVEDQVVVQRSELRTIGVNGKKRKTILRPPNLWLGSLAWTPNGRRIVFAGRQNPNLGPFDKEVYSVLARTGRDQRQITDDQGLNVDFKDPDVSPNGRRVVVSAYDGAMSQASIVSLPVGGGPIDVIATPSDAQFDYEEPTYSPDGKRIVFVRRDGNFEEYYLLFQGRLDGAVPNQSLMSPPLRVPTPSASPFGAFGGVWAARRR